MLLSHSYLGKDNISIGTFFVASNLGVDVCPGDNCSKISIEAFLYPCNAFAHIMSGM